MGQRANVAPDRAIITMLTGNAVPMAERVAVLTCP